MSHLVEYLLAFQRPGGGKLCRLGVIETLIPIFPPGLTITWEILPEFGSYANIEFWYRISPSVVPGVFDWDCTHYGAEIRTGILHSLSTAQGYNVWIEITDQHPIISTFTNVSPVNQFFDSVDFFLVVDSEADLNIIRSIVMRWGTSLRQEEGQAETNYLLRQLFEAQTGKPPPPPPSPPPFIPTPRFIPTVPRL